MLHIFYASILTLCIILFSPLIQADYDAISLLKKMDELYRSENSTATINMHIVTPNWQRTLEMQSWTRGMDDTFIRVLAPKKDKGVSTLKISNEMWNYFPKINKTIKVPPSMMMGSWMGSDFTNDDLVREVSLIKEYDVVKTEVNNKYHLTLTPKNSTVTVWARIEILIDKNNLLPVEQSYFNEKGKIIRSMYFSNIREFSGKKLPSIMSMVPHNKEGNKTEIEYITLDFNTDIDSNIFSLRNLQKRVK